MRRRGLATGLGAVLLAAGVAACSPGPAPRPDAEVAPGYSAIADRSLSGRGPLTLQLDYDSVETGGLDPQLATTARSWSIESLVYEPLVTIDPQFRVKPLLAQSWKQTSSTRYVFTLRTDVRFANGRAMTTDDVVGSLRRLVSGKGVYASQLGPVRTVAATGPNQVTVVLKEPYTPFLAALTNTPAAILPMKEIAGGSLDPAKTMLGTGPFVVDRHRQDESWTFLPNRNYRNAASLRISRLNLQIVAQESTRVASIRDGSAGLSFFNNVDVVDLLDGTRNARVISQRNSDFFTLITNTRTGNPLLRDQKLRFAINAAIDRKQIANIAFGDHVRPTGVTPAVLPGACDPSTLPSAAPAARAAAAGQAEQAGAAGKTLRLAVYNSEPAVEQIAQVIQQQLKKIGVTVTIQKYDDATFGAKVFDPKPDFDLAVYWYAGYVDPAMVARWWNPKVAGFSAVFLTDDPTLDTLIARAGAQPAGAQRTATLADVCRRVDTGAQMLPLVSRPSVIGYRTDEISPTLFAREGYGNILRSVVDYTVPDGR